MADTVGGTRTTVLFFPERRRYYRQQMLQQTRMLRDVMPKCLSEADAQELRCARLRTVGC